MTTDAAETTPQTAPIERFAPFADQTLNGRIALVAGATRGAGRAIARDLARAGAFVHCTGRSTLGRPSDYGRAETIEETASLITAEGGQAEAHVCDHLEPARIAEVIRRIDDRHGRLDILVNDIGGEAYVEWGTPFWETDLPSELRLFRAGLLTHLHTAHAVLPLLTRSPGGLHIEITDGTAAYNAGHYRENILLDLTKTAVSRLAFGLGHELDKVSATAIAITPGWLRSEMMLDHFGTNKTDWMRDSLDESRTEPPRDFAISETPHLLGRSVVALASDPDRHRFNTTTQDTHGMATHYGFNDLDGSRPDSWSFITTLEVDPAADPREFR
ncbi:SDR family oxidoreductase [Brevibacterium spongiae]|uniref:SDR family oxidoreductase n=1 Tax=Brevibacterium spongiae TaxID=2909672 RepID=A0ABY5SXG2_9MICO|nr:SDR family oxidoreductase [Brevibacterium spongiae]UVI37833.1 SDR family oxidoreductase [Brevibacterium spongiae]